MEQLERLEQNSTNSSKPPSSDSPFVEEAVALECGKTQTVNQEKNLTDTEELETQKQKVEENQKHLSLAQGFEKKKPLNATRS